MKKALSGFAPLIALLVCLLPFQNCGSGGLPDLSNSKTSSSTAASSMAAQIATKYILGRANQTDKLSTVGTNWTNVPGASLTVNLPDNLTLDMRANGSVNAVPGTTYTSGHCGMRFVVDGVPYGDSTWGDVIIGINANSITTGWWTPWTIERHLAVLAGLHTVQVQQTGWSGTDAGCSSSAGDFSAAKLTVEAY